MPDITTDQIQAARSVTKRVTLIVKTFNRPDCLLRLVQTARTKYPGIGIMVADDGNIGSPIAGTDWLSLPFDSGLSLGRNKLLAKCPTDLFVLCDDDFIFDERTDLAKLIDDIDAGFDIAGGSVDGMEYNGRLRRIGDTLYYLKGHHGFHNGRPQYDMVLNFFVGRTKAVREVGWDAKLKLAEHTAFFYGALGRLRITFNKNVVVGHDRRTDTPDYEVYRRRGGDFFNRWMASVGLAHTVNFRNVKSGVRSVPVDMFVDMAHYMPHALPLWAALPCKGDLFIKEGINVPTGAAHGKAVVRFNSLLQCLDANKERPIIVMSGRNVNRVSEHRDRIILARHGIGQVYNTDHALWGGKVAKKVALYLAVGEHDAAWAKANDIPHALVGSPRMDSHFKKTVAVSFHWPDPTLPETGSSVSMFLEAVKGLRTNYRVIGHGHPRSMGELGSHWRDMGVEVVTDFERVIAEADVYVCDNSSTLYEFAAAGKPVVVLNNPAYRRDVEHPFNPRFWKHADVGVQVDSPDGLAYAVALALADPDHIREARHRAVASVFGVHDGQAAKRAAAAIVSTFNQ